MPRPPFLLLAAVLLALPSPSSAQAPPALSGAPEPGGLRATPAPRDASEAGMRLRYGAAGPGRFGLLSYVDVPVYQPATPMPGTHIVGIPGHAGPRPGESHEAWEWRVLRTTYGAQAQRVHRGLEVLAPEAAARVLRFEGRLRREGIQARRLETWRDPVRQAYLFQQGRSRPGPLATSTLTSWHSQVDEHGCPAGRAVDYAVPAAQMVRFHEIARRVGLQSFGADSNDPGHVFLPDRAAVAREHMAVLLTLPRVPEVTLATGLPVDRGLPPGGRTALFAAAAEFAALPCIPHTSPSLARVLRVPGLATAAPRRTVAAESVSDPVR